jgi:sulfur carrier protein
VRVIVNGREHDLPDGALVREAVQATGAAAQGIAVALEGEVVPRSKWDRVALRDGQRVEVVQAVQGG